MQKTGLRMNFNDQLVSSFANQRTSMEAKTFI